MDALLRLVRGYVGDEQTAAMVFIGLTAAAIFVLALGVSLLALGLADPLRRRLRALTPKHDRVPSRADSLAAAMQPAAAWFLPKDDWQRNQVSRQLVHAGLRSPNALTLYYASRTLLLVLLPAVVVAGWSWFSDAPVGLIAFFAVVAAYVGHVTPGFVLDRLVAARARRLRAAFPDALDLLVVCVESGLGLAPAIQRVADEIAVSHGELAAELNLVNVEMRAGVDRSRALKNLAERSGLEDIRGLVALLIQTMRFGTSVADALRVYSEEFRDRRTQAAEEQAAKIGTKMIFPLVLCMFPAFFLVVVGPAALRLVEVFGQLGQ